MQPICLSSKLQNFIFIVYPLCFRVEEKKDSDFPRLKLYLANTHELGGVCHATSPDQRDLTSILMRHFLKSMVFERVYCVIVETTVGEWIFQGIPIYWV